MSENSSLLIARIDNNNACVPIFSRNQDISRAIASVFKIWVLGAVALAVEDGSIASVSNTLPLIADDISPVGATINEEPLGTQFSITDLAALMMGVSDNTATDHLFNFVGRPANEEILDDFNFSNTSVIEPFLTTNEAFHLFFTRPLSEALSYASGSETFQRNYLNNTLDPLGPVTTIPFSNRETLLTTTWQANTMDICNAIAGLRKFNDLTDAFNLIDQAYGANAGIFNLRNNWERVWFKGGSLFDTTGQRSLSGSWLLESDDRGAFVVVSLNTNDSINLSPIDSGTIFSVLSRVMEIIDENN